MLYIIDAPESALESIRNAVRQAEPHAQEPTAIVRCPDGRITPLNRVTNFYQYELRPEFPMLLPWDQLDKPTQTNIAVTLSGYIAWHFPEMYEMSLDDTYSDIAAALPETVGKDPANPPPKPEPMARPDYVLTSITTVDVSENYATICESTVDGQGLIEWEDLSDSQKAHLVEACQDALGANPAVDLSDVIMENTDWDTYSKPEDKEDS